MEDKSFSYDCIDRNAGDYRTHDLWASVIDEEDELKEQEEWLHDRLAGDRWLHVFTVRRGFSFETFCNQLDKYSRKYFVNYTIRGDAAVCVYARSFTFSYVDITKHYKLVLKERYAKLLGDMALPEEFDASDRCYLKAKDLLKFDQEICEKCELIEKLRAWRKDPRYQICLKKFREMAEVIEEGGDAIRKYSNRFLIALLDNGQVGMDYGCGYSLDKLAKYPLAQCVQQLRKIVDEQKEVYRKYLQWQKSQYERWIKIISSYRETDPGDIEQVQFGETYFFSDYTNTVLHDLLPEDFSQYPQVKYYPGYMCGRGAWRSADDIKMELKGDARVQKIRVRKNKYVNGKTLSFHLNNLRVTYDDNTLEVNCIPHKEIARYAEDMTTHFGCGMGKCLELDSIFRYDDAVGEMLQKCPKIDERMSQPVHGRLVECVRYLLRTVSPVVNEMYLGEYGNYLDLNILDNDDICVRIFIAKYDDWCDFEVKHTFKPNEDFEMMFRVWWHQALMMELKWLKGEVGAPL